MGRWVCEPLEATLVLQMTKHIDTVDRRDRIRFTGVRLTLLVSSPVVPVRAVV